MAEMSEGADNSFTRFVSVMPRAGMRSRVTCGITTVFSVTAVRLIASATQTSFVMVALLHRSPGLVLGSLAICRGEEVSFFSVRGITFPLSFFLYETLWKDVYGSFINKELHFFLVENT